MSSDLVPALRADVQVSVHREDNETFLVLHDVMGIAEGPIMVHADMVAILEACDGNTSWSELAVLLGVEPDASELLQLRAFIGELDRLGFFDTQHAAEREQRTLQEWDAQRTRPAICAGSTYPSEPDELRAFLNDLLSHSPLPIAHSPISHSPLPIPHSPLPIPHSPPTAFLIPHIDFRVSPQVYAPAFNALRDTASDLFVVIGTSHYWADDRIILTDKDFDTPLGSVRTDRALVQALRIALSDPHSPLPIAHSPLSDTDLAHKPEHSIELHAVLLKHVKEEKPFTMLPILVTGFGGEHDPDGREEIGRIASAIREVVAASGRKAIWLISGDLAHIGQRFGDPMPAAVLLPSVREADADLLRLLEQGDVGGYHAAIEANDQAFRVCGHAPTVLALDALGPVRGTILAYDVWDDQETASAVTFATMAFGGTVATP